MTDQKEPETIEDTDLDEVQGAGNVVGKPGKDGKILADDIVTNRDGSDSFIGAWDRK